jgi:hypothetical protein
VGIDVGIESINGFGEPFDMGDDTGLKALGDDAEAKFFGGTHVDELAAAADEFDQRLVIGIGQRPGLWADGGSEKGDRLGIKAIGFG